MLLKKIFHWGDKLEDRVRGKLSHYPITYAFIGGAGVIIFWRGIWHTMDFLMFVMIGQNAEIGTGYPWWDGPLSIFVGTVMLLTVGLFIPTFIGNEIIMSGLRGEKKLTEKTEQEISEDVALNIKIVREMKEIERRLESLEKKI